MKVLVTKVIDENLNVALLRGYPYLIPQESGHRIAVYVGDVFVEDIRYFIFRLNEMNLINIKIGTLSNVFEPYSFIQKIELKEPKKKY